MVLKHSTAVRSVAFSPNSAELATSTAAGTLCLWELTGETLSKEMRVCEQNARRCWWSPDASYVVVTCEPGGVVLLLDLKTGESKARFVSGKSLQASAMASDANRVFITTKPGAVFLLSLENRPPSIS
jgi:WD40 repeat protein